MPLNWESSTALPTAQVARQGLLGRPPYAGGGIAVETAIEQKMKDQAEFVRWWDENVRKRGNRANVSDQKPFVEQAEAPTSLAIGDAVLQAPDLVERLGVHPADARSIDRPCSSPHHAPVRTDDALPVRFGEVPGLSGR